MLASSSFDNQGERGSLGQHAFKHLFFFPSFSISEVVLVLGALKAAAARPPVSLSASAVAEHSLPWTPTED